MLFPGKPSFSDASHLLRTHLTIIVGEAELALRRERDRHQYKEVLERILKEANAMQVYIDQLLQYFEDK